jgi:hypothetical protein
MVKGVMEIGLVAEVFLPTLLIFTVMFLLLQKTKLLGGMNTLLNAIVSFAFSAIITFPHIWDRYPMAIDPVLLINNYIFLMSFVIVSLAGILLLITHLDIEGITYGFGRVDWMIIIATIVFIFLLGWAKYVDILILTITLAVVVYAALYQKSRITEYHFMPPWVGITIFLAAFYAFTIILGWTSYLPSFLILLDHAVVQIMILFVLTALGEIGFITYFR